MSKMLYKISQINFDINKFDEKIDHILKLFEKYNDLLNKAPFDAQFLSMQLLKYEARHSNMIEGIDTNDIEILAEDTPVSKKIVNYVNALKKANQKLLKDNFFTKDLILEIHKNLFESLISVDAIQAKPGQWRTKQVKIANHIPPDTNLLDQYLQDLIQWLNDSSKFKEVSKTKEWVIKAVISHAYFEKIHPFTDGNGRVGRILFNIVLNKNNLITKPYFYISKAILKEQFFYYQELSKLDEKTDYNNWIEFFLNLLIYQLNGNIKTFELALNEIFKIRNEILTEENNIVREIKKSILEYIAHYPIFTFSRVYFVVKPNFELINDKVFVLIFNQVIKKYNIKKIRNTKYYEFSKVIEIIIGKDW